MGTVHTRGRTFGVVTLVMLVVGAALDAFPLPGAPESVHADPVATRPLPDPLHVTLTDAGFTPERITVVPGQSIDIVNGATVARTITSGGDGTFDSGAVARSHFVVALPHSGSWTASDGAAHVAVITVGRLQLEGDALDRAVSAIPDEMPPDGPVLTHPDLGLEITRNRILIGFTDSATVTQANAALAAADLTIVGGNSDLGVLVTEVADPGTSGVGSMQDALDLLRTQPGVRTAAYDISVDPDTALPRPVNPDPGRQVGEEPYTWESVLLESDSVLGSGSNAGLESSRFPQAWNWLDEIRDRLGGGSPSSTVVLDSGFDTTHPDLGRATLHRLCTTGGTRCTDNPPSGGERVHGTATASIVGAAFNRGAASSTTSQGIVGGDPISALHLVPWFVDSSRDSQDTVSYNSFLVVLDLILDHRAEFGDLRVINLSGGFSFTEQANGRTVFEQRYGNSTCGPGAGDDFSTPQAQRVPCTPNSEDTYLVEFHAAALLMLPLAVRLAANNVLLVVAAGNDSATFCADRPRPDLAAPCTALAPISTTATDPFGYLASIWPAGGAPPWVLVEAHTATISTLARTNYSNTDGTISAPGAALVPVVGAGGVASYHVLNGTSMAAPYVSAAAGLLSNLTPSATTVRRLLVERGPVDVPGSTTPRLDVYAALLGLPAAQGIDALLDVNDASPDGNRRVTRDDRGQATGADTVLAAAPDGRVDMRDFRRLRDAWLATCAGQPTCPAAVSLDGAATHPKKDLNLDGCIGPFAGSCPAAEQIFSRLDFNGDGLLIDRPFTTLLDAAGVPVGRGTGTKMTDLDVFQTRFGQGPNADTEGWTAADLDDLLVSADVELHLDALWAGGTTSAEVTVGTASGLGPRLTFEPRGTGDVRVYTVPIDPVADLGNGDLIQVRVVAQLPGGDATAVFLSEPLTVEAGEDVVVVPCTSQFVLTPSTPTATPGGTVTIEAALNDCTGRPVVNSGIAFEIASGPTGSALSIVEAVTDAQGVARTQFTYPDGVNSAAQIVASAYPAVDGGERLQRAVDLGPASDIVVHYRYRQTILDYARTSTNEWDCTTSCFSATQEIHTHFFLPGLADFLLDHGQLERTGTITPSLAGGATIDESVRSVQQATSATPDAFDIPGIRLTTTVEEWDAADPTIRQTKIYDSPLQIAGQPSAVEFADVPAVDVPAVDFAVTDAEVQVTNLRAYADEYAVPQAAYTLQRGFLILPEDTNPDLPIPNLYQPLQQIPTDLALVPRADSSSLAWDWDPDAPLVFAGNGDGTYQPVTWCGTRQRLFDNSADPGYWSDTDPAITTVDPTDPGTLIHGPYRDPDDQRAVREAGDRAAPRHDGSVTSRFEFVAVVTHAGDPVPDLDLGSCTDSAPKPIVGFQPEHPVEGQTVQFHDVSSFADGAQSTTWRFADSAGHATSDGAFQFSDNGTYSVDFTVVDADGVSRASEPADIVVANAPPSVEPVDVAGDGRTLTVRVDDPGPVDRRQLEVRLTSPTPGWPSQEVVTYASPPTDSTGKPVLGAWPHTVHLPDTLTPGVYFVVLSVLDKDGAKASLSFSLAVPPVASGATSNLRAGGSGGSSFLRSRSAAVATVLDTPVAAAGPVPAFVVDKVSASTGEVLTVRNATRSAGVPATATLDPGDGRPSIPLAAGAGVGLAYAEAGTPAMRVVAGSVAAMSSPTITGAAIPAVVAYVGATGAPLGADAAVAAHATRAGGTNLPGVVVRFTLDGTSVDAVSGNDGVARAELPVGGPTGGRDLVVTVLPNGAPVTVPFTVTANSVPVADAGPDQTIGAGAPLNLTGSASDADPGEQATLAYRWDLDGDGAFDDAAGPEPSLDGGQVAEVLCGGSCSAGQAIAVALRVTDVKGGTAVDTVTITVVRDFAVTIDPPGTTLVPNANVSFTVGVVTTNGFGEPVTLSAPSLPAGVTATFDPPTVTPDGTSLLTLRAGATFTPQDFALVVRGISGPLVREAGSDLSLEFGLIPQCFGTVTGRVTDATTGAGLAGLPILGTQTALDGTYTATRLALDTGNAPRTQFIASLGADFYPLSPQAAVRIACGITSTLDISLVRRQFGAVAGTVTGVDADGTPLGPVANATFALNRRTGPDGRYSLTNLVLGPGNSPTGFAVGVSASGFHARSRQTQISAGTTSTLDIVLLKVCTASVRVRVLDQRTGKAVVGARVDTGAGSQGDVTDADGIALIAQLGLNAPDNAPAQRTVRAFTPDGVQPPGSVTTGVVLGSCGAQVPVDIAIPFPRRVEANVDVLVVDDTGAPVPDATVRIGPTNYSDRLTGADGRTTITHLLGIDVAPTLTTTITAFATGRISGPATAITLREGQTTTATVTLFVRTYGAAEGTVRDRATGAPVAGVRVSGASTTSGADGRYRVEQITLNGVNQPAQANLSAFDQRTPPLYWPSPVVQVTARAGEVTQVPDLLMIRVCAPATVRGRVINAATGQPIQGALVRTGSFGVLTDADGRFVLTDVQVGNDNANVQYTVTASKSGFLTAQKNVTVACGADVVVDFGRDGDGFGAITGRVTDAGGNPVRQAAVTTGFGGSAVTNADGTYTIAEAPAGESGAAREWEVRVAPPTGSVLAPAVKTATVRRDESTTVDFVLDTTADDPPVAASFDLTIEPGAAPITLAGADPTNDPLTFAVTLPPAHGSLAGTAPDLVYTPDPGFAGEDRIEYTASDGTNTSAPGVVRITVLGVNEPPVARITGDLDVDEGSRADLSGATSTDREGSTLTYAWDLDGAGEPDDTDAATSVRLDDDGSITVALTVTDARGASDSTTALVTARNVAPVVELDDPEIDGTSLELFGDIVDPGDDTFTATVDLGDGAGPRPLTDDELGSDWFVIAHRFAAGGSYRIVVAVCDDDGGCSSAAIDVTVTGDGNAAPQARITGGGEVPEGALVTLSGASSTDPEGSTLTYAWDLDGDGVFDDGDTGSVAVQRDDDEEVDVRLRVTDGDGATGTSDAAVEFVNVAPHVVALSPMTIAVGESIDVGGSFADPGADEWDASVDWGDGGPVDPLALDDRRFVLAHAFIAAGRYVVALSVCDDDGGCGVAELRVTVGAVDVQPPVAAIDAAAAVDEGGTATLDGGASSDPDGDVVAWAWDLDADGEFDDGANASASLSCADDGPVVAALRVTDDDGAIDTVSATVVCRNVAPRVAAFAGATLVVGEAFATDGLFSDPGADTWEVTVDWGEGGGPQVLTPGGTTFALAHPYPTAGSFTVTVAVCDDDGGCGAASAVVQVEELPPPSSDLAASLVVSDPTPSPGDTISWALTVVNDGPAGSGEVTATIDVPVGLTFVGTGGAQGLRARRLATAWTCGDGPPVVCTAPDLAAGTASTLTLRLTVDPTANGRLVGTVTIASASADPDPTDNTVIVALDVAQDEPTTTAPPVTEPSTTTPADDPPTTAPPSTDAPATDPPATDPPATDPPATTAASTGPPATSPTDPPAATGPSTVPPSTTVLTVPSGGLPVTGGDPSRPVRWAVVALLVGSLLLVVRRIRRPARSAPPGADPDG